MIGKMVRWFFQFWLDRLGLLEMFIAWKHRYDHRRLDDHGVLIQALATDLNEVEEAEDPTEPMSMFNKITRLYLEYTFEIPDRPGKTFVGEAAVADGHHTAMVIGHPVPVRYLPENPKISRLEL